MPVKMKSKSGDPIVIMTPEEYEHMKAGTLPRTVHPEPIVQDADLDAYEGYRAVKIFSARVRSAFVEMPDRGKLPIAQAAKFLEEYAAEFRGLLADLNSAKAEWKSKLN